MIGLGKAITHAKEGIDYALRKDDAEVLIKNNIIGNNGQEIKSEFVFFQNRNQRCINNDYSFVLSPSITDGSRLTNDEFSDIAKDFLKKLELDKHQYIVVKHNPKGKHKHLHIFVNRIDQKGKAHDDKFIGKKAQRIADDIAQERELTRATEVKEIKKTAKLEEFKELRKEIFRRHKIALNDHKAKSFKEYQDLMKSQKVDIIPSINKQGKLQGYRVAFDGVNLKASEVHRQMTLSRMKFYNEDERHQAQEKAQTKQITQEEQPQQKFRIRR